MQILCLSTVLFLTSLFAHTAADITFGSFPTVAHIGESYTLSWNATANYTYNIWLIAEDPGAQGNPYEWTKVAGLASGLHFDDLRGSLTWTASNVTVGSEYALYFAVFTIPFNGQEFQYQTAYFNISDQPAPSATKGAGSSATATAGTSPTSSNKPSSESSGHKSISGGAIAGIVIGCILAIALLLGGFFFIGWRKKRSAVQKREAAARASRLEPVMQESSASYEMQNRKL